jgi:hypothetical protein
VLHQPVKAAHAKQTKGSWFGHVFRRIVHVCMLTIPLIYYAYGQTVANFLHISTDLLLILLLVIFILVEIVRLKFNIVTFGQRKYEGGQISSFAWGAVSVFLVLLLSPAKAFSIPIIWSCALGDPFVGELRALFKKPWWPEVLTLFFILAIWLFCSYWLTTPWWWGVILAPIIVMAEWVRVKNVDDNAMMMLVPLVIVLAVYGVMDIIP